jgi:hypothetical protein
VVFALEPVVTLAAVLAIAFVIAFVIRLGLISVDSEG